MDIIFGSIETTEHVSSGTECPGSNNVETVHGSSKVWVYLNDNVVIDKIEKSRPSIKVDKTGVCFYGAYILVSGAQNGDWVNVKTKAKEWRNFNY